MSEAISKLYAEIGFNVKADKLSEFSKQLEEVNNKILTFADNLKKVYGDIKFPTISSAAIDKNFAQNINALSAIKKEERLKANEEEKRKNKEKREQEKRDKEKKRDQERFQRGLRRVGNDFVKYFSAAAASAFSLIKGSWSVAQASAKSSMMYGNFGLLTGDLPEGLKALQALAASTGSGMGRGDIYSQLIGLSQNWASLVQDQGNAYALKVLGLNAQQSPTEMADSILGALRNHKAPPAIMASLLSQLGLNPSGWMRMANATNEQKARAAQLQQFMVSSEGFSKLNKLNTDFESLGEVVLTLKDRFSLFLLDEDTIESIRKFLMDPEVQEALEATATGIKMLGEAIAWCIKFIYETGKSIGFTITDSFVNHPNLMKVSPMAAIGASVFDNVVDTLKNTSNDKSVLSKDVDFNDNKQVVNNITVSDVETARSLMQEAGSFSNSYLDSMLQGVFNK